jgi:hypothetical protein
MTMMVALTAFLYHPLLFMCTQIKNHRYIKPNTMTGKTEYKWKTEGKK